MKRKVSGQTGINTLSICFCPREKLTRRKLGLEVQLTHERLYKNGSVSQVLCKIDNTQEIGVCQTKSLLLLDL